MSTLPPNALLSDNSSPILLTGDTKNYSVMENLNTFHTSSGETIISKEELPVSNNALLPTQSGENLGNDLVENYFEYEQVSHTNLFESNSTIGEQTQYDIPSEHDGQNKVSSQEILPPLVPQSKDSYKVTQGKSECTALNSNGNILGDTNSPTSNTSPSVLSAPQITDNSQESLFLDENGNSARKPLSQIDDLDTDKSKIQAKEKKTSTDTCCKIHSLSRVSSVPLYKSPPTSTIDPQQNDNIILTSIKSNNASISSINRGDNLKHEQDDSLLLLSLPVDSLHFIAGFLTITDWVNLCLSCKTSNRVCREIFRRIRMHGFRCATEIITAWELGHLADAKELAALYVQNGVPIYPYCLGHSYDTIVWRMSLEANQSLSVQEDASTGGDSNTNNTSPQDPTTTSSGDENKSFDQFYTTKRIEKRATEGYYINTLTYLEEKSLFTRSLSRASSDSEDYSSWLPHDHRRYLVNGHFDQVTSFGRDNRLDTVDMQPIHSVERRGAVHNTLLSLVEKEGLVPLSQFKGEKNYNDRRRKMTVPIHRHLRNMHSLSKPAIDEDFDGRIEVSPIRISADFYCPIPSRKSKKEEVLRSMGISDSIQSLQLDANRDQSQFQSNEQNKDMDQEQSSNFCDSYESECSRHLDYSLSFSGMHQEFVGNSLGMEDTSLNLRDSEQHRQRQELQDIRFDRNTGSLQIHFDDDEGILSNNELPLMFLSSSSSSEDNNLKLVTYPILMEHPIMEEVALEVYDSSTENPLPHSKFYLNKRGQKSQYLRDRFSYYRRKMDASLNVSDNRGFEDILFDFWDEFFPLSRGIHFFDCFTPVPRMKILHDFLTKPVPKAVGMVQCEIQRIKVINKKKNSGMKGRIFPQYEYRLFIKDRRGSPAYNQIHFPLHSKVRMDTLLMSAKNLGKHHNGIPGSNSNHHKKGVNNYHLYMPHKSDIDHHFEFVNNHLNLGENHKSFQESMCQSKNTEVGRLQSNIIGTEFQIYSTSHLKTGPVKPSTHSAPITPQCLIRPELGTDVQEDIVDMNDNQIDSTTSGKNYRSSIPKIRNKRNSLVRLGSWPTLYGSRSSRTSRRAIANSTGCRIHLDVSLDIKREEEIGAITYTANLLGNRPRIMDVCIPRVSVDGSISNEWIDYCKHANSPNTTMLNRLKILQQRFNQNDDDTADDNDDHLDYGLLALQNRPPWWNIDLGAFVLNFGGRVSVASVKNFQLCDRDDHENIILQFGRIQGRHAFTMDFSYPLTAVQAFAIAISSLQSKIAFA
mmetsp:Transcript_7110/g.10191  ORF Transcript_7110/g.10191 Transcript_7110/m.10191 type:complete len:1257 (-) Transcript_7110:105-3875(-)